MKFQRGWFKGAIEPTKLRTPPGTIRTTIIPDRNRQANIRNKSASQGINLSCNSWGQKRQGTKSSPSIPCACTYNPVLQTKVLVVAGKPHPLAVAVVLPGPVVLKEAAIPWVHPERQTWEWQGGHTVDPVPIRNENLKWIEMAQNTHVQ